MPVPLRVLLRPFRVARRGKLLSEAAAKPAAWLL